MSPFDWLAVFACCAVVAAFSYYTNRPGSTADRHAWQDSTGSDPQTVADDVAEARRGREIEQLEAWLQLPAQARNTIPHQRSPRTEEDQ